MHTRICSECGTIASADGRFCVSCGSGNLIAQPAAAAPAANAPVVNPPSGYAPAGYAMPRPADMRPQNEIWRVAAGFLMTVAIDELFGWFGLCIALLVLAITVGVKSRSVQNAGQRFSTAFLMVGLAGLFLGVLGVIWYSDESLLQYVPISPLGITGGAFDSYEAWEAMRTMVLVGSILALIAGIVSLIATAFDSPRATSALQRGPGADGMPGGVR